MDPKAIATPGIFSEALAAVQANPFFAALALAGLLLGVAVIVLVIRARKPAPPDQGADTGGWRGRLRSVVKTAATQFVTLIEALRYIADRREWRYRVPWMLLVGAPGSGKTSLAASSHSPRREQLSSQEEALAIAGTRWCFFERGVVIDLESSAAPAGQSAAQRAAWGAVVRGLFNHRPERPLDGVVVTLSARTLLGGSSADLKGLAERSYAQLVDLQRRFEFTFPVYVVVTQCDAVQGFGAFWRRQPPARRAEMVGWSSPYSLDAGFLPAWIDEAFAHVGLGLKTLQVQAATASGGHDDADAYFLFPQRFGELHAPLKAVCEDTFRQSAYHANFLFRGIYFTGAVEGEGVALQKPRDDVAFVDALLDEKLLAEPNLAQATRSGVWSRHELVRKLQIGMVAVFALLCVWLGFAAHDLEQNAEATAAALVALKDPQLERVADGACIGGDTVYNLLDKVSRINVHFTYAAIPASWLDRRHTAHHAEFVADQTFERVIFPSLRCHLEAKAALLVKTPPPTGEIKGDAVAKWQDVLLRRLQDIQEFEKNLARYRLIVAPSTVGNGDALLKEFEALAIYLYGEPLPASVRGEAGHHRDALAEVAYPVDVAVPPELRQRSATALTALAEQTHRELFRHLSRGGDYLAALQEERPDYREAVQGFIAWMHWVQGDWLGSNPSQNLCRSLSEKLTPALQELYSRYGYPQTLIQAADGFDEERCYRPAMALLSELHVAPHGLLFPRREQGLAPAPELLVELRQLEALNKQGFMQRNPRDTFQCKTPLRRFDGARLAEAAGAVREFDAFLREQHNGASAGNGARSVSERAARRQLEAVVEELVHQSQVPFALADAQAGTVGSVSSLDEQAMTQSADFGRVVDSLVLLVQVLKQRGFAGSAARIEQCARNFAVDALHNIDALAAASRLFSPGFSAGAPLASDARLLAEIGTEAEAKEYVHLQLQRSQILAGYAVPFATLLANTRGINEARLANSESESYWSGTIRELNRYVQFKEQNGQVAHLEALIVKQLLPLTAATCGAQLTAYKSPTYGNDLFSAQRAALEREVSSRCLDHREQTASAGYRTLAREFNQSLAGRYPFGPDPQREAAPAAVKEFLRNYAKQRGALRTEIGAFKGERWRQADEFLDGLDAAAAFFGSNLAAGEASQPVQLRLQFRVRPEQSPGSEQLVNWRFRSGVESASYPNGVRELQWQYGRPVALELTWAEQSHVAPASDPVQGHLKIERNTAVFSADGPWALMKLVQAHGSRQSAGRESLDPGSRLLEFEVPIAMKDGSAPEPAHSRMFMTLQLLGRDPETQKSVALTLPEAFPHYAPLLW